MATAQMYSDNRSVVDIAKELEYSRNLKRARIAQQKKQKEQKYMQHISKDVNISKKNISKNKTKTQAQRKQGLLSARKNSFLKNAKARRKLLLINKRKIRRYKRAIKRYERTPWMLMYVAAVGNILGGLLTEFVVGYIFVIPCTIFIDIMVWRARDRKNKKGVAAAIVLTTIIKITPIVSMLPASIILVWKTQQKAHISANKAKKKLKRLKKRINKKNK